MIKVPKRQKKCTGENPDVMPLDFLASVYETASKKFSIPKKKTTK